MESIDIQIDFKKDSALVKVVYYGDRFREERSSLVSTAGCSDVFGRITDEAGLILKSMENDGIIPKL